MEGLDIESLKPCQIVLPPAKTFLNARNIRIPLGFNANSMNRNDTNHTTSRPRHAELYYTNTTSTNADVDDDYGAYRPV
eukprot:UN05481